MPRALLAFGIMLATAGAAEAHTFGADGAGFAQGVAHPFGGVDHVLAMVAVGLWAAQLGGRARWSVPLAFVAAMALGGLVATFGMAVPGVELGIVASLLVLGALVAASARLPAALGAVLVGALAVFHGHAHGAEMPEAASATLYALGFALATASLHGIGLALGLYWHGGTGRWLVRAGGAGVAAAGLALLLV